MKKIRLLICFIAVLMLVSVIATADHYFDGGYFKYRVNNDEVAIYGYVGEINGVIEFPSHISGHPVTVIDTNSFKYCKALTEVIFPETVKRINANAFIGCEALERIAFKDNSELLVIEQGAFLNCTKLNSVMIPESIVSIGASVFFNTAYYNNEENWDNGVLFIDNCLMMSKNDVSGVYDVPEGTITIAARAFSSHRLLEGITIPDGVKAIGSYAFEYCSSLKEIVIPDSVRVINSYAFSNSAIESINTGKGITALNSNVFSGCKALKSVTLHNSLLEIENKAFNNCTSLKEINIPNSVTLIYSQAFRNCTALERITIPNSVKEIQESAFEGCTALKEMTLPFIGSSISDGNPLGYIFTGHYNWEYNDDNVPASIEKITLTGTVDESSGGFYKCTNLKTIILPEGITRLSNCYFQFCSSLESIVIPDTVTRIDKETFWGCKALKSVNIPEGVTEILDDTFRYCGSLTEIDLPRGLTRIGNSAFLECKALKSVSIPEGVTHISDDTFRYCESLANIDLPRGLMRIGKSAFMGCNALKSLRIPASVAEIDNRAFEGIEGLTLYVYENSAAHQYAVNNEIPFMIVYEENDEQIKDDTPATDVPMTFEDMPDDWSATALRHAVANGLIQGTDGKLLPGDELTRAQMAAILVRAFGATEKGDITGFTDVDPSAWYYDAMAISYKMGLFKGAGSGRMNPDANITRQEAFVVLSRAFALLPSSTASIDGFTDSADVADWAKRDIAVLVEHGYVGGRNGRIDPDADITRAEFAQVMYNLVKTYVDVKEDVPATAVGNVVVRGNVLRLQDITVDGDLIIGEGASYYITLTNVNVKGRVVIRAKGDFVFDGTAEKLILTSENSSITLASNSNVSTVKVTSDTSTVKK